MLLRPFLLLTFFVFDCGLFLRDGASAQEAEARFNAEAARRVVAQLDKDEQLTRLYPLCPADIFRKEASVGGLLFGHAEATAEHCAEDPAQCHRECIEKRSASHCFKLAVAFQRHESETPPRSAQMLFQLACAQGEESGCTNRGAHLRNASDEGDPLMALPRAEQESCQRRSFETACKQDDPWGCAMFGQALRNGEGGPANRKEARRAYEKACALAPDLEPCEFSKAGLKSIRVSKRKR